MTREVKISLGSVDKVKKFVSTINQFDIDIDLVSGRYVIDAKSILGIFSIDLSNPVILSMNADEEKRKELMESIKEFIV